MTGTSPDLRQARGHWLARRVIAWPDQMLPPGLDPATLDWTLHWSPSGGIDPWAPEPVSWHTATLQVLPGGLPRALARRYKHLEKSVALQVPEDLDVAEALRGQVAVTVQRPSGRLVHASGLQISGVLDEVYADAASARLGATWTDGVPTLRVWAPTAREVELLLWDPDADLLADARHVPMARSADGTWSVRGEAAWQNARYLYAVTVFVPSFQRVETNRVTDPYSLALTLNSTHSVLVDLAADDLRPDQWLTAQAPALASAVDQVIYELHVRDFSRADRTVSESARGRFLAFTEDGRGTRHLRTLAEAGLNTVQLLPVFDNASVEEDPALQHQPDRARLRAWGPDSTEQQAYVARGARRKPFNWGYDPWHYQVPEGSFATPEAADGRGRVRECRAMIGAIHGLGLRVVLDQVYNHTVDEGQGPASVFGRIVPGYYHRLDPDGNVWRSTCCPNVATEHLMAGKLMVDSCVLWVKHYRVDGFRFDLMGHHSVANMLAVRAALDALTPEADGVDGRAVTMYGEGWNFGEVENNARFVQATQGQLAGTHIGTFSDRLRDAVRGGSALDSDPRAQGFGTGLFSDPNDAPVNGSGFEQRRALARAADLVQLGLAGTMRDYAFVSQERSAAVRGSELDYAGVSAGYTEHPDEAVNYVDAHDNETLFDALTMKLPVRTPMAQRVRANTLCLALATLGQSPVMWHAGSDFLRSKSLDRNSYDSGDWFNYLDFSLTDNGFGAGLPPAPDNAATWPLMRPLLANPELKPSSADMRAAHEAALDLLRVRASSRLFRLGDPAQVRAKVSFPVSGSWAQVPGVIVMYLDDDAGAPVDERWRAITVAFNGTPWPVRQQVGLLRKVDWVLHPVLAEGSDAVVRQARCDDGVLSLPGRTAAVFVWPR